LGIGNTTEPIAAMQHYSRPRCHVGMDASESREYNVGILNQTLEESLGVDKPLAIGLLHLKTLLWRGGLEGIQFPSGCRSRLEPI
jgi:hypothetical protein